MADSERGMTDEEIEELLDVALGGDWGRQLPT
jgi:hypothetical protein